MVAPISYVPNASSIGRPNPKVNHVNLMTDTIIANSSVEDLRVIVRALLATTGPNTASTFSNIARDYMRQSAARTISSPSAPQLISSSLPTTQFHALVSRSRVLYGSGMGLESVRLLTAVVRATLGVRWEECSELEDALAVVDCDLCAALLCVKSELMMGDEGGRAVLMALKAVLLEVRADVEAWGGDFPYERALDAVFELAI